MIRFENVSYSYPFQNRPAASKIDLRVRPGELVLCTGASGCGKSTLIRLANGLCPHYFQGSLSGQVLVGQISTKRRSLAELSLQLGTVFQDPQQQFLALGVEEELALALKWQGLEAPAIEAAVRWATQEFELSPILASSIHCLSDGQKQKVALASQSLRQPQALILDEPSANLDPQSTSALALKLERLKRQGLALLVADHRLYWLEGVADRVLVMAEGRIQAQGGFEILRDEALRQRYGLRSHRVEDCRHSLPKLPADAEALLQASKLSFAYPRRPPLFDGVNFKLPPGLTALIGPNGAGKTTLARLLAGLVKPSQGEISLAGRPHSQRQRLKASGLVLQNADHQLYMRTVRQELESCLFLAGLPDKGRVDELLQSLNLSALAERHPQSLSGGEKQRLVIACALAKEPRLLILDEPTSGLDCENMRRLAVVIKDQAGRGRCVALISHDLELLQSAGAYSLRLPFEAEKENAYGA